MQRNGTGLALNLSSAVREVTVRSGLEVIPMVDQRPAPIFVADSAGLDFLNSIATPLDTLVEWIGSGEDLIQWMVQARLVPPEAVLELRKRALPDEFDAVAAQARKLREWFRGFVNAHKGKPLKPKVVEELQPLNRVLARDEEFGQVIVREAKLKKSRRAGQGRSAATALVWRPQRRWRSPDALLFPIAKAMAQLLCEEDFQQVKACEGHRCTLMFVDRTRGRARRWCSMSVCGNRAKQAAHRARVLRTRT
jgi:predicted RNA-binding Zn ribbon-like protein